MPAGMTIPAKTLRSPITPRQIAAIRVSLFLGSLIVVGFRWVHLHGDPGAVDLWRDRLLLAGLFVAAGAATFHPLGLERLPLVLWVVGSSTAMWAARIAWQNHFSTQTVVGLITVFACGSASMRGRLALGWFTAIAIGSVAAAYAWADAPRLAEAFVLPHLFAIAFFSFLLAGSRQRAEQFLAQSESLRRYMVDQTTDALVIIDPIDRVAVEHNNRARELFELGLEPDPATAAAAVFGTDLWGAIDAVLMLKETSGGSVYRRERTYRTPAGRSFAGDLVVSQVRYGVKLMLLVRVTDISDRIELARRLETAEGRPAAST